ncbi:hypothetical protein KFE25_007565 [Diacronema lutheri]|uniref:Uncharacterized protein n=1 Tax=Diacronema lutheri TaxID=2081491 RepID=A0A8J5XV01_DIALT|nr:hypothetical protein KFE25_007565 [Diacronema lutheri]
MASRGKRTRAEGATSEQLHCAICRTTWPAKLGTLETHRRGRKHRDNVLSDALYAEPGHRLAELRFDGVSLPHAALPAALARRARAIWAFLSSDPASLVALAGVDRYQRVLDLLIPERLACAGVRLHLTPPEPLDGAGAGAGAGASAGVWRLDLRSAASIAYACSVLEHGPHPAELAVALAPRAHDDGSAASTPRAPLALVELTIGAAEALSNVEPCLAMAHTLPLLGRAMRHGCATRTLRVRVRHPSPPVEGAADTRAVGSRLVARLVAVIGGALGEPAGLRHTRCIELHIPPELVRAEHTRLLDAAERGSWRGRLLALLLGTHARVGAGSLLRLLPAQVLELIGTHASEGTRTTVLVQPWEESTPTEAADGGGSAPEEAEPPFQVSFDKSSGALRVLTAHASPSASGLTHGADVDWLLASGIPTAHCE